MKNLYVSDDGKKTSENIDEIKAYEADCAKNDDTEVTLTIEDLNVLMQKTADIVVKSVKDMGGLTSDVENVECNAKCIVSEDTVDVAVSTTLTDDSDDESHTDITNSIENSILNALDGFPFFKSKAITIQVEDLDEGDVA